MSVQLSDIPRVRLAHLPTPLELLPRLSQRLGGPQIYLKRDDCTGLALGGNKVRKLEYLLADAVAQGADTLLTEGGVQSNHCRQAAAAVASGCDVSCSSAEPSNGTSQAMRRRATSNSSGCSARGSISLPTTLMGRR